MLRTSPQRLSARETHHRFQRCWYPADNVRSQSSVRTKLHLQLYVTTLACYEVGRLVIRLPNFADVIRDAWSMALDLCTRPTNQRIQTSGPERIRYIAKFASVINKTSEAKRIQQTKEMRLNFFNESTAARPTNKYRTLNTLSLNRISSIDENRPRAMKMRATSIAMRATDAANHVAKS